MKAAIIAGCTVLSVLNAPGAFAAAEKGDTLSPAEFDKPYTGELQIVRIPNKRPILYKRVLERLSESLCKARAAH